MIVVADANVLLRVVDATAGQHAVAVAALSKLQARGATVRTVPQTVHKFWGVATRPQANTGLGLTPAECAQEVDQLTAELPPLDDPPGPFAAWRELVAAFGCRGKVAHDARYVAALRTHGLSHLLTFNVADFARCPGLTVLDPHAVATP